MGSAERRERDKEVLRQRIVEAARDILSEKGLEGLSMRAIAERIEYSPATIYLYFQDKDALLRAVVGEAFQLLGEYTIAALREVGPEVKPAALFRCTGRAYVRFALENTAYFRIMFELPGLPQVDCPEPEEGGVAIPEEQSFDFVVRTLTRAVEAGELAMPDPLEGAVIAWGLMHGLTSLYLSGRLGDMVTSSEQFQVLVEAAMDTMSVGWLPRADGPRLTASAGLASPHPCAGQVAAETLRPRRPVRGEEQEARVDTPRPARHRVDPELAKDWETIAGGGA
ncbi:MAG TPA: TetR/AcrR family transcriptional regulator [Longimicrobiales bacterium]|nr:TetR/AcrR family transcriptional regulator [Longimicrobiales bacterium]